MNLAIKKVRNTFRNMSLNDIETFLATTDLSDFDKKLIRLKTIGADRNSVMVQLNCTEQELFNAYQRIAKSLE